MRKLCQSQLLAQCDTLFSRFDILGNILDAFSLGRNIRMRAIRPIEKGEEIMTNYGAIFGLQQGLKRRREWYEHNSTRNKFTSLRRLERGFKFSCQCAACASHGEFAKAERLLRAVQCQHCVGGAAVNETELEQYQLTFTHLLHDNYRRCFAWLDGDNPLSCTTTPVVSRMPTQYEGRKSRLHVHSMRKVAHVEHQRDFYSVPRKERSALRYGQGERQ